ncbi:MULTISPECIES: serine aminopeptidase domain-containing protein [unclassified Amycolatopsis]|uniref:alpha/beta hydrolase n=1 Tax=unclassified Amycolatopsis TaxID=2618356 RepID=UPI0028756342|nr:MULTISPECIES: alpha/beta hydrolase [unclassified Amycolatopsis]MDS0138550.1 alpha/beta hydrolase [Amycolatopsis sp. 505]MDS0146173.1 alpha/beta hydrolase [Amycolatopsis sp. CM201R]
MSTDPAVVARTVVDLTAAGRFAEVEQRFAPRLRAAASAGTLRVGWETELAKTGPVRAIGTPLSEPPAAGLVRVSVPVTCERGGLTVVMSVDDAGLLHGLRLAPPTGPSWVPPAYAEADRFTEHEVTVGTGPLAVPGTLTVPRGRGPWPAVVLLASGPADRDLTTGPNKPFKDLAWGLASRGVAVARFDKVTHVHPETGSAPGFTMADEYVPHALAAVRLLQEQEAVAPARVFVLGLSGGGKAVPRVAAAEPSIAGLISLAGDTLPLPRAAVRVARYLAEVAPGPATSAAAESVARQAALVESPELSPSTPAADLLFGWPASYWLDLRGYDPVATAAALDRPVLILQGGRDYQVTAAGDLVRWQEGLADRPDVTIRVHEAADHLFFRGEGPSTPAGYEAPQHVDPAVVTDIAAWISAR